MSEQVMEQKNKMGTKAIFPLIMSMSIPPMISMLIQSLYNIVDSIFVARYSQEALTAVSLAFPIQNIILAVAIGTGVGINSLIARRLGEKKKNEANQVVSHGILLAIVTAFVFIFLGLICIKPFFHIFTKDEAIFQMGCDYTYIVTLFAVGVFVHIAIEKVLQATGKMIFPMIMQAIGAIVNIILDPILIFGLFGFPQMGVRGAAIATVIGQFTAMAVSILVLVLGRHDVKVIIKGFKWDFQIIKNIYVVGLPSILMQSLGSFLVMGLNGILIKFSSMAVSIFGSYYKLQTFVYMPVNGLIQGTMPVMGYNYGAKNKERLMAALKSAMTVALVISITGTLLFCLFPTWFLGFFLAEPEMMDIGSSTLRIISISYPFAGISFIMTTLFQAMGNGLNSLLIAFLRQIVIILPLSFLLAGPFGLNGVWITFPIAEIVSAIITLFMYQRIKKQIN